MATEPEIIHRWRCTRCTTTHEDFNPKEKRAGNPPGWCLLGLKGTSHLLCGGCVGDVERFLGNPIASKANDG